ncbi:MAG: hypothetical protein [Cressdnaviricota sp.]|nr:MAG: hypothetical protein [Cressdnaviricota sp.]
MAKRRKVSKAKKPMMIKTTQRDMALVAGIASEGMTIELDRLLSQSNSKLYRQGMNYHARVSLAQLDGVTDDEYKIYTLPKDHRTIGAIRMAKSIYNQAMQDELEIRPEVKTPWTDFKINVNDVSDVTLWPPLINEAVAVQWRVDTVADKPGQYVKLTSDDYAYSQVTANDGNQKFFSLADPTGTNYWNIFSEYTNYLLNRADPDSSQEIAAYENASPVLTELEELADKGDQPPYNWEWNSKKLDNTVVNHKFMAELAGVLYTGDSSIRPTLNTSITVEAPLGLIFIIKTGDLSATTPEIRVRALPGNYKGVKADMLYRKDKLLGF